MTNFEIEELVNADQARSDLIVHGGYAFEVVGDSGVALPLDRLAFDPESGTYALRDGMFENSCASHLSRAQALANLERTIEHIKAIRGQPCCIEPHDQDLLPTWWVTEPKAFEPLEEIHSDLEHSIRYYAPPRLSASRHPYLMFRCSYPRGRGVARCLFVSSLSRGVGIPLGVVTLRGEWWLHLPTGSVVVPGDVFGFDSTLPPSTPGNRAARRAAR